MATTIDPTSLMIQMFEQMEQQRIAERQEMQQRMEAREGREAEMLRQLAQLPFPTPPTAMKLLQQLSTGVKIEYKEFSSEPEDWNTWSKAHQAQLSALGCADVLTAPSG